MLGDFVFAIWDKGKQTLFSVMEHMGVKAFYYYYQPGKIFALAREIKALLCLPEVPCRLNEVRIADYLKLMIEDKVIKSYQHILPLPPAHSMVVNLQGTVRAPYQENVPVP